MKQYKKSGRVFLNTPGSGCLAAVSWNVSVHRQRDYDFAEDGELEVKSRKKGKWKATGSIIMNEEAQEHYVYRKACMKAIHTMQKELNKFEAAMSTALADAEEANDAES